MTADAEESLPPRSAFARRVWEALAARDGRGGVSALVVETGLYHAAVSKGLMELLIRGDIARRRDKAGRDFLVVNWPPGLDRTDPKAGTRACLKCGRPFWSEWPGNRRCKSCLALAADQRSALA